MQAETSFTVIETQRLFLRRLMRDDAEFIRSLLNEPSWLEFIGNKKVYTLNDAKKYIELTPMTMYERYGFGLFLVCDKGSSVPMGLCGLMKRDNLDDADLGYAFLPEFCHKGFAIEAVESVLGYAKNTHQLSQILTLSKSSNEASIKLLKKVGFLFDRDLKLLENEENLHIYTLKL